MLSSIKAKAIAAKVWSDQYLTRKELIVMISLVFILQKCL